MNHHQNMVIPNHLVRKIQQEFKHQLEELKKIQEFMSLVDEMQIQFLDSSNDNEKHSYDAETVNQCKGCQRKYENNRYNIKRRIDCINAEIRTAKLLLENPPTPSVLDKKIKDITEKENTERRPRKWISLWADDCGRPHCAIKKKHGLFSKMAKWKRADLK